MAGEDVPFHGVAGGSRGIAISSSGSNVRSRGGSLSSLRRRERREGGGEGGRSGSRRGHSFSRRVFGSSSSDSESSDDELWSRSASGIVPGLDEASLRLAFHGRRGSRGRSVQGENALAVAAAVRGDNYGHRRLPLWPLDLEGSLRSRSAEHCFEATESPSGGMLPGVEVARRRRVRGPEPYGGYGGQETGQSGRSRSGVAHHHHHYHHHHHHHVHQQPPRNASRPGTPRPASFVRRMQDILQEHRTGGPFQMVSNSTDGANAAESNPNSRRGSRAHALRSTEGELRSSSFSSLWRRQSSDTNLRGTALEARNRLDERLRAAAVARHSNRLYWPAVQSSYEMNFLFSDDEEDNIWSDDDGWETSLHEWLAAWAPSVEERRSRAESSSLWRSREESSSGRAASSASSSNGNPSSKHKASEGLTKAAINALPRQIVGSVAEGEGARGKLEQEDCPVCLEGFVAGQCLMSLPCNHRFHPACLTPWLDNHGQCPYCRADIIKDNVTPERKARGRTTNVDEDLLSWVEAIERGMDRLNYS